MVSTSVSLTPSNLVAGVDAFEVMNSAIGICIRSATGRRKEFFRSEKVSRSDDEIFLGWYQMRERLLDLRKETSVREVKDWRVLGVLLSDGNSDHFAAKTQGKSQIKYFGNIIGRTRCWYINPASEEVQDRAVKLNKLAGRSGENTRSIRLSRSAANHSDRPTVCPEHSANLNLR